MTMRFKILSDKECMINGSALPCCVFHDNGGDVRVVIGVGEPVSLYAIRNLTCVDFPIKTEITINQLTSATSSPDFILVFTEDKEVHISRSFSYKKWRHSWHLYKFVQTINECFSNENPKYGKVRVSDSDQTSAFCDIEFVFPIESISPIVDQIELLMRLIDNANEKAFEIMNSGLTRTSNRNDKGINILGGWVKIKPWSKGPIEFNIPKALSLFRNKKNGTPDGHGDS